MKFTKLKKRKTINKNNIFDRFENLNFDNENFKKTIFRNCYLKNIKFDSINFEKIEFWKICFQNVIFKNCKFNSILFSEIIFSKIKFINCSFNNVQFAHSYLEKKIFSKCKFKNISFNTFVVSRRDLVPKKYLGLDNNKAVLVSEKRKLSRLMDVKGYFFKKKIGKFFDNDRIYLPKYTFIEKINKKVSRAKFSFKFKEKKFSSKNYLNELVHGNGFVQLDKLISPKIISKAVKKIEEYDNTQKSFTIDKRKKQFYLNNLFKVDKIFEKLIPDQSKLKQFSKILGPDFFCGFYGANFLGPGARGQRFHFDYPYPTMYRKNGIIQNFNYKFPINLQAIILLSDIDDESGTTDLIPGSQKLQLDPQSLNIFEKKGEFIYFMKNNKLHKFKIKKLKGRKGTVILFNGLNWHRAGDNLSINKNRITVLFQFLSNHIRPQNKFNGLKVSKSSFINQLTGNNLVLPSEV